MSNQISTPVYFIEPGFFSQNIALSVFLCRGDAIDGTLGNSYSRAAADSLGIKVGTLVHEQPIEQMFQESFFCTIYRVEGDDGHGLSDWYTDKAEVNQIAENLHGNVREGNLSKQMAKPLDFPVQAYINRGEKGLFVRLNINPDVSGQYAFGCYLFPDRSCTDLQEGPCEIESINMRNTYGFFKGHMKQYQMPSEEAIAEYLLDDPVASKFWSIQNRKLYFVEGSVFGSFAYIYPTDKMGQWKTFLIADRNGKCVESDCLMSLEDAANRSTHNGLSRMSEELYLSGTVKDSVSLGDFLFEGYQGCSLDELLSKFHPYQFEKKLKFRDTKDFSTDHIPDELYEFVRYGIVEPRQYQGIQFVTLNEYQLKSEMCNYISMPTDEMNKVIDQFNSINQAAEDKTRSLLKRNKLSPEIFCK